MELVQASRKAFEFAPEDVINSMPDNVIVNILDRLPLQDAVRTSILSRDWRPKWTMLTQLVFDAKFYDYLLQTNRLQYYGRIISRLLHLLRGSIRKFVLYIEEQCYSIFGVEDINNWVTLLSRKGIKEFTLFNIYGTPLTLHTPLFSCLQLKHLELYNCVFSTMSRFRGFPNLLSLAFYNVAFESFKCWQFLTSCPLLEILILSSTPGPGEIKCVEIAKLENLKVLDLSLCELDNREMITSSSLFQLLGSFSKLQELDLDFLKCKVLADSEKKAQTTLSSLKILRLYGIDFNCVILVSCAIELIGCSPNLETLEILATYDDAVPQSTVSSSKVDCSRMGELQLQNVVLHLFRGLENEICLIKFLLDRTPLLKKMVIRAKSSDMLGGDHGERKFTTTLLKLHRASPLAEIDLHWF